MELEPIIRKLQDKGYSRNRIAEELNKRKVPTPRRGSPQEVRAQAVTRDSITLAITMAAAIGLGGCFWHHQQAVVT
jgi:hypothetical protein